MTSKDYLSQEEIDALLRQSSGDTDESSSNDGSLMELDEYISPLEQDALGEIGNITFGSAATALSTLLGKKVDITTPTVSLVRKHELGDVFPKPHVAVSVEYVDGFEGINSLVIRTQDAQIIADLMLGGEGTIEELQELNDIHISAVQEAMNQMMGSSATSMSTIFNRLVNISPPGINILDVESGNGLDYLPSDDVLIKISFHLKIGDLIDSTIMQLLPIPFARQMVNTLMGTDTEQVMEVVESTIKEVAQQASTIAPEQPMQPQFNEPAAADTAPPITQQTAYPHQNPYGHASGYDAAGQFAPQQRQVNVQPVQFANFNQGAMAQGEATNLNLLLDIPLKVTVELGRTQKQIKDILELSQGSIIELDKLAGEPVDILVNNKLIAKGEVVVIDENFGVRVTDIVSQWDRIQKLQ